MKVYKCHKCGKIITEDEIALRDKEGKVYCKPCSLLVSIEEKKEEEEREKAGPPVLKEGKKLSGFQVFLIVMGVLLLAQILTFVILKARTETPISIEEIAREMPGIHGKVLLLDYAIQTYAGENGKFPKTLSELFPDYVKEEEILYNDELPHYQLSDKWGFVLYYTDEQGKILEPVLTRDGFMSSSILEGR